MIYYVYLRKPVVGVGSWFAMCFTSMFMSMLSWPHDVYFKWNKQKNRTLTRRQQLVCTVVYFIHCLSHLVRHFPSMVYVYNTDQEKRINTLLQVLI